MLGIGFAGLALGWIQALAAGSPRAGARLSHLAPPSSDRPPRGAACSLDDGQTLAR